MRRVARYSNVMIVLERLCDESTSIEITNILLKMLLYKLTNYGLKDSGVTVPLLKTISVIALSSPESQVISVMAKICRPGMFNSDASVHLLNPDPTSL
jgi:hypothetical protein